MSSGTALGVTQNLWLSLGGGFSFDLSATLQSTSASYGLDTSPANGVKQGGETRAPPVADWINEPLEESRKPLWA